MVFFCFHVRALCQSRIFSCDCTRRMQKNGFLHTFRCTRAIHSHAKIDFGRMKKPNYSSDMFKSSPTCPSFRRREHIIRCESAMLRKSKHYIKTHVLPLKIPHRISYEVKTEERGMPHRIPSLMQRVISTQSLRKWKKKIK